MPRSGAPHTISEEERDQIYDLAIHKPHTKIRQLQDEVSTPLTKRTILRLLREMHKKDGSSKYALNLLKIMQINVLPGLINMPIIP
jgi:hypothetical protein